MHFVLESAKSSDVLDPAIKYGGGSKSWRNLLTQSSQSGVAAYEEIEKEYSEWMAAYEKVEEEIEKEYSECAAAYNKGMAVAALLKDDAADDEALELRRRREQLSRARERIELKRQEIEERLLRLRNTITDFLNDMISWLDEWAKGQKQ